MRKSRDVYSAHVRWLVIPAVLGVVSLCFVASCTNKKHGKPPAHVKSGDHGGDHSDHGDHGDHGGGKTKHNPKHDAGAPHEHDAGASSSHDAGTAMELPPDAGPVEVFTP